MTLDHEPAPLWQAVLESLRAQLPSSTYHTWVADAEPVAYQDGRLTLGAANAYAREMLAGLAQIPRTASQVLGRQVRVEVVLTGHARAAPASVSTEEAQDRKPGFAGSADVADRPRLSLTPQYLSRYDEIVRPERVVSIPRYYLRWIRYLGVDLAWIPIAFRQVAYFRGLGFEAGDTFQCSHRELALWSGMSERNLYRKINDPRLGWFIRRADQEKHWSFGQDGAPHREALSWVVMMSMPLTPADQISLAGFLRRALAAGLSQRKALQAAYEAPLEELLPLADMDEIPEMAGPPRGVEQVVEAALGREMLQADTKKLVAALSIKIAGYGESLEITHYFIRHHLPRPSVGPGRGWLVQVLRAISQEQGFPPETIMRGGHVALGSLLGVNVGTVRRWMGETRETNGTESGIEEFLRFQGMVKHADGRVDLVVRVSRDEPVLPEHERSPGLSGTSPQPTEGLEPDADSVMHEVMPDPQPDSIRTVPGAQPVMHGGQEDARAVRIGSRSAALPVMNGQAAQPRKLSGVKGAGGLSDMQTESRGITTSLNGDAMDVGAPTGRNAEDAGWDLQDLLRRASVHPATRARLQGASAVAWVSWLLYWASPLGERLLEPTGNAVSRLKEAPDAPMAGAFERLAALGPDGLAEMVVPRVASRFGYHPSTQDWDDIMAGASDERLRRLVDLLGFNMSDADQDRAEEGEGGLAS